MENRDKHIDDLFREGLGNYSETPPAMAWGDLEKRLDEQQDRRRPFPWFWYALGIALLALLGYYMLHNITSKTSGRKGSATGLVTDTAHIAVQAKDSLHTPTLNMNGGSSYSTTAIRSTEKQNGHGNDKKQNIKHPGKEHKLVSAAKHKNLNSRHRGNRSRNKYVLSSKKHDKHTPASKHLKQAKNELITAPDESGSLADKPKHRNHITNPKPAIQNKLSAADKNNNSIDSTKAQEQAVKAQNIPHTAMGRSTHSKHHAKPKNKKVVKERTALTKTINHPKATLSQHALTEARPAQKLAASEQTHAKPANREVATGQPRKSSNKLAAKPAKKQKQHEKNKVPIIQSSIADENDNKSKIVSNKLKPAATIKATTDNALADSASNSSVSTSQPAIPTNAKKHIPANKSIAKGRSIKTKATNNAAQGEKQIALHEVAKAKTPKKLRDTLNTTLDKLADSGALSKSIGAATHTNSANVIASKSKKKTSHTKSITKAINPASASNKPGSQTKNNSIASQNASQSSPIEATDAENKDLDEATTIATPQAFNPVAAKSKKKKIDVHSIDQHTKSINPNAAKSKKKDIDIHAAPGLAAKAINPVAAQGKKKKLIVRSALGSEPKPIQPAARSVKAKPVIPVPTTARAKELHIKPANDRKPKPINPIAAKSKKVKKVTPIAATFNKHTDLDASSEGAIRLGNNSERDNSNLFGSNTANAHSKAANVESTGDMSVNMSAKKSARNFKDVPALQPNKKLEKEDILAIKLPLEPAVETFPQAKPVDRERVPEYLKVNTGDVGAGGDSGPIPPNFSPSQKKKVSRYEAGLKVGYEAGTGTNAANKPLIAPFLQYNINPKLGLILQPTFKSASLSNTKTDGTTSSYYNNTSDSEIVTAHHISVNTSFPFDTSWKTTYHYIQHYDSIIAKKKLTSTSYVEFELPLMLQYKLVKNFAVLGGVSIIYSRIPGISSSAQVVGSGQLDTFKTYTVPGNNPAIPPAENINSVLNHTGSAPYSSYSPTVFASKGLFRFGYMIGFNYAFKDRLLFDVMIQQNLSKVSGLQDQNLKDVFSQAYFHITLGYKLYRSKKETY